MAFPILSRGVSRYPATGAAVVMGVLSLAPLLLGWRYLGLDHSRVLLAMMCGGRGADGFVLDASLGGGGPLLEEPQGLVLYPLNWLLRAFDVELAASLFVVVHLAFAAAAATHLGRAKGLSRATSFFFGLAFASCGSVLDLIIHGPYLVGAVGLPLAWAGAARLTSHRGEARPKPGALLMLAGGPALLLLAGELQAFGIACALIALEMLLARRRAPRALVAGALLAGSLVGGAQLILSLALAGASSRSSRVPDPFFWSLSPGQLLGVLWPGAVDARAANGATLATALAGDAMARPPWNVTPLLGAAVIALALGGAALVMRRRSRPMLGPALVALFATLFALGSATPVLKVALAVLPPLGFFRYPAKYFVVASLALLLLAFHMAAVAARSTAARSVLRRVALAALVVAVVVCLVLLGATLLSAAHIDQRAAAVAVRPPWPGEPALSRLLLGRGALALLFALLPAGILLVRPRGLAHALPLTLAMGLVLPFMQGLPLGRPLTSLPRRDVDGAPGRALVCQGQELGARHVDHPDEPLGIEGDIIVDWLDLKPNMHQCVDIAVPHAAMASSQGPTFALATSIDERAPLATAAWALGCTHLATRVPPAELPFMKAPGSAPVSAPVLGLDAPIYPLPTHLDEVTVVHEPLLLADGDAVLAALAKALVPADVARLLDDPMGVLPRGRPLPARPAASVQARVQWDGTTGATVSLQGSGGVVVVLRHPWWPGFEATQAGAPIPVVRAAGVQLALVIDDVTRGDVALVYRVKHAVPALLSLLAGAALLAVLLVRARARPRSAAATMV